MRIVLTTESLFAASRLRDKIIRTIRGGVDGTHIDTWSYVKSKDNYDVIYHNPPQYAEIPEKNVVFRIDLNGENLIFSCSYWTCNPQPTRTMYCIHVGRSTEMLLNYFSDSISKYVVIDY